ncbi:MlaE family ABC transporter permease [Candidatus Methylacidithermus pantelleriae]|uniref:Putative ABC transporter permease protein RF_0080 n=1 Tax=Candidatus Methylacidithermus pantelleriae TaxID=2744239 RepID=A0A8J2BRT1_9BACT|nr:ABC transporter permease [Candidatus Methylacidithermus pantelleriae]CAF0693015.1 putative ABC transporter permease protein RF_0080 [Candidatus Methylacidithermus pantelleriae]
MMRFLRRLGARFLSLLRSGGQIGFLFLDVLRCIVRYGVRWRILGHQLLVIGARSQPIVLITGAFTGAVFAAQTQFHFSKLGISSGTGPVVSLAMLRELGPVLCALMVSGRVGSAMAAEISTMKITEQIDALRALAVYPTDYLVVPRFLGMLISMPILVALTSGVGILCGYLVAVPLLGVEGVYYWNHTLRYTELQDVWMGEIKALFFGLIIALMSCHRGLQAMGGAEGVGRATTEAMVFSSLAVLISNFFFSFLMNILFSY